MNPQEFMSKALELSVNRLIREKRGERLKRLVKPDVPEAEATEDEDGDYEKLKAFGSEDEASKE